MFGIVLSALNAFIGPLLKAVFIKSMVFMGLAAIVTFAIDGLSASGILPSASATVAAMGGMPSFVLYILQLFRVDLAVSLIFAAAATRFIIRRIPFIG